MLQINLDSETDFSFYYAKPDDKMTGRLIFGKSQYEDKPNAGSIGAIYVLKGYWGKGYGWQMMAQKRKLKQENC